MNHHPTASRWANLSSLVIKAAETAATTALSCLILLAIADTAVAKPRTKTPPPPVGEGFLFIQVASSELAISPETSVYIDGDQAGHIGDDGTFSTTLPVGHHKIKIIDPGRQAASATITTNAKDAANLELRLKADLITTDAPCKPSPAIDAKFLSKPQPLVLAIPLHLATLDDVVLVESDGTVDANLTGEFRLTPTGSVELVDPDQFTSDLQDQILPTMSPARLTIIGQTTTGEILNSTCPITMR